MASGVHAAARAFVELCLRDKGLPSELSLKDTQVLLGTVQAAGFKAKSVEPGRLFARRKDDKGTETYLVNANCPFKVIGQDGLDDGPATEWLDRMVFTVLNESGGTHSIWVRGQITDREAIADKIRSEMEECLARQPA
ncbi:MAG: hypothetical protein KGH56_03665 [Patescibacteria group bacterium]|nr:hypothetical protein [Patescibacteria group bacterium]